jgi:ribosomal-protein-alanine N-acetyltransferase
MIETDRLIIRKHKDTDWKDLYEYLSLKEIYIFEPGEPITKEDSKKIIIERSIGNSFYAVVLKDENKMIGHLYFNQTEPKEYLTWELGFIFNPNYQKRGFCTEASKKIIQYGFDNLNIHKVVSYCNPKNIASWKVLKKIGMKREGFFRKQGYFLRDENNEPIWHDCYVYGILKHE